MYHITMMARFNEWANSIIFAVCSELTAEEYRSDRKMFFGSVHNTLNHILLVDQLWLCRLRGYESDRIHSLDQELVGDFDELRQARTEEDRLLIEYVGSCDERELKRAVAYRRMNGQADENTVEEILLTVFNHQTHHRGQVHAMLTQLDREIPDMDVVDYLKEAA